MATKPKPKRCICGICRNEIIILVTFANSGERNPLICPICYSTLPSSKKELLDNVVGAKHIHTEWKDGDIIF